MRFVESGRCQATPRYPRNPHAPSALEDWTLAYGFGTGVQIPIPSSPGLVLEFKANYQTGPTAEFLTKGDATFDPLPDGGGNFDYQLRRSPLEMLTLSVGLVVYDVFR